MPTNKPQEEQGWLNKVNSENKVLREKVQNLRAQIVEILAQKRKQNLLETALKTCVSRRERSQSF